MCLSRMLPVFFSLFFSFHSFSRDILWEKSYDFGKTDVLTSIVENGDGSLTNIATNVKTESVKVIRGTKE